MRCSADDSGGALRHDDAVVPADGPCDVAELIRIGRDREAAERGSEQEEDMSETLTPDDLTAVKEKQHATWSSGDYAVIGTTLQLMGEQLCEAVDVSAGWKVLDVAAGNGNAALAAARRGCEVVATDYVEGLLDRARTPGGGRRADPHHEGGRCRGSPLRGRHLRCRAVHRRRDVHTRSPTRRGPAGTRRPPWRPHRTRQLDPRRVRGSDVQDHRRARPATRRRTVPSAMGHRGRASTHSWVPSAMSR